MKDRVVLILGALVIWVVLHDQVAYAYPAPNPPAAAFAARQTRALEDIAEQLKKLNQNASKCR